MATARVIARTGTTRRLTAASTMYVAVQFFLLALGAVLFYAGRPSTSSLPSAGFDQSTLMQPLGVSIIAAAVTGLAAFAYVLLSDDLRNRVYLLEHFGFQDVFDSNTDSIQGEYAERFGRNKNIDILGLGLNKFRRDFADELDHWLSRAEVRLLVLAPDYPTRSHAYSRQRDREERDQVGTIQNHNVALRQWLAPLRARHGDRLQVREYTCLPSITMVRIDKELFWSPYLMHRGASASPTFLVKRSGMLYDVLMDHFEEIWKDPSMSHDMISTNMQS